MPSSPIPLRDRGVARRGRPRAVLAVADVKQAQMIRLGLLRVGWSVVLADDACHARQLLADMPGGVAILGTEMTDESGWLACAKLTQSATAGDVLLVGPDTPRNRRLARFVGAAAFLADPVEVATWLPPAQTSLAS